MLALRILGVASLSLPVAAQAWLEAARQVSPVVGEEVRSFADFDGDGDLDLVVTRPRPRISGIERIHVAFGTGDGEFVPGPSLPILPTGYQADAYVLAGDVTGDGLPDIVTSFRELSSNPGSGIVLYRNLGNGAFAAPRHSPAGVPSPLVRGVLDDWDGDGVLELVAAHLGVGFGTLHRWSYRGGAFVSIGALPLPDHVGGLAAGELTGDGLRDVVLGAAGANEVHVVPTRPGGGFGPVTTWTVGPSPATFGRKPACGDVDGDGDDDVVVGWWTGSRFETDLAVVEHDGAGGLTVGPDQRFDVHPGGYWNGQPHVVDWDGDGDGDVVVTFEELHVLENRGAQRFAVAQSTRVARSNSGTSGPMDGNDGVGAGDFDGDGLLDFVSGRAVVHGTGRAAAWTFGTIVSSAQRALDLDGDGDLDVLSSGGALAENLGGHRFVERDVMPAAPPGFRFVEATGSGDFDGDGHLDLLATFVRLEFRGATFLGMHLLGGTAHGTFVDRGLAAPAFTAVGDSASFAVVQDDLDGDGDVDIAVRDGYWVNSGNGTFTQFVPAWTGSPTAVVDVDADGRVDVLTREVSATSSIHRIGWNGGGTFMTQILASGPAPTHGGARAMLADLDDDGDLDFAVGIEGTPTIELRANQGGTFAAAVSLPSGGFAFETLVADDFDGDGRVDLAAFPASIGHGVGFGETARVWLRTGPGLVYGPPRDFVSSWPVFDRADFDGDGDREVYGRYGSISSGRWSAAAAGSFEQYGTRVAGASGIAPLLGVRGPVRAGGSIELRVRGGEGGGLAVLHVGLGAADAPLPGFPGISLLVSPIVMKVGFVLNGPVGVPGAGFVDLPLVVPASLRGAAVFHQAIVLDGVTLGASNGLRLRYGG